MCTLLLPGLCAAQLLTDNGAAITVQPGVQLTIKGSLLAGAGSSITNNGTIDLTGDLTNNSGGALFTAVPGTVIMKGPIQSIAGSSITTFDNLDLQCATLMLQQDIRTGGAYASPAGVLALGNCMLRLNTNRITITDPLPSAITRLTGEIVSETTPAAGYGEVEWVIGNSTGVYTVPFGDGTIVLPLVYIPVTLNVTSAGSMGGSIVLATYPTDPFATPNNRPLPTGLAALMDIAGAENAPNVVDRFWPITTSGFSTPPVAAITFTYRDSEWNSGTNLINEAALQAQRFDGTHWSMPPNGGANLPANTVTTSPTNTFDMVWALVQGSTPLPVELLAFDAVPDGNDVRCSWATASEQQNDHFTVERSADGALFEDIGTVAGAGDSQSTLYYSFLDRAPLTGLSYYRLRQTDIDGTESRSQAVVVWMGGPAADLVVFPDPATSVLFIAGASTTAERVNVLDMAGRCVISSAAWSTSDAIDIADLPAGTYTLEILDHGARRAARFIKQ